MSVFSEAEIAYLQSNTMGRLATIGPDGMPHLVRLTDSMPMKTQSISEALTSALPRSGETCCRIPEWPFW
jgi:hypothetical protein